MSIEVTVSLSDKVYNQAALLAKMTNRDAPDILAEKLENELLPLGSFEMGVKPVEKLSDDEVLAEANLMMNKKQGKRLSYLLGLQQEEQLTTTEKIELSSLVQIYQECFLRKGLAIAEAVRRGLKESVEG